MVGLTDVVLRRRAGATAYQRGTYCARDVADLTEHDGEVSATVVSSSDRGLRYQVRLRFRGGELTGTCDCPQGLEGRFCKHCAAVGLRLISSASPAAHAVARPTVVSNADAARPSTTEDERQWQAVEAFLASRRPDELAGLLRDAAHDDPALRHRLWLLAAAASEPAQLAAQTEQLGGGFRKGEGAGYARKARSLVFALSQLPTAEADTAHALLPLVLDYLLDAIDDTDTDTDAETDIDSYIGPSDKEPVREVAGVAWQAYLRVCAAAPPDPDEVASWFVDLRLHHPDYRRYLPAADLAGVPGVLAACRDGLSGHDGDAREVWVLQDEVLLALGDTDAYVAFLAQDLSTYQRYARIAEVLIAAGRAGEAVTWLERARQPATEPRDDATPVVELLARLYIDQGRLDDALRVRRRHFASARTRAAYRALREAALQAGADWPALRAEALNLLRQNAFMSQTADTLVRILIDEGEAEEAWQVANRNRCEGHTLIMAANARAVTHPADAIPVYWPLVDEALRFHDRDRNRGYERAVDILLILRDLTIRSGGDFRRDLAKFKATHGRKRNLMTELARRGL